MYIADAANVLVPAYLAICRKGYLVKNENGYMTAELGDRRFLAEDPLRLLGLIALAEIRGAAWQASDEEIDDYLRRFES